MKQEKTFNVKDIASIGIMAALILISSKIEIVIGPSRIHMGNILCLFSAFYLKPLNAGLSSGLGSMFFDLLFHPGSFAFDFIITFINKFVLSFVASIIYNTKTISSTFYIFQYVFSGLCGQIAYIILYMLKTFIQQRFLLSLPMSTVLPIMLTKLGASSINAILAIIISTILFSIIGKFIKSKSR
ncbi:MAG: ECF transporter S component [Eubacteriales bacterium]|nr:ECF transporter S component [Eubacteriales bacterium]